MLETGGSSLFSASKAKGAAADENGEGSKDSSDEDEDMNACNDSEAINSDGDDTVTEEFHQGIHIYF